MSLLWISNTWQLSMDWFKPVQTGFLFSNFWLTNFIFVIPIEIIPGQKLLS